MMTFALLPPFFPTDSGFLSNPRKPELPHFQGAFSMVLPTGEAWGLARTLYPPLGRAVVVSWDSQNPNPVPTWATMGLAGT